MKKLKSKEAKQLVKSYIASLRGTLPEDRKTSKNVKDGLENMLYYFDTVWEDRWWDSYFMLKILDKKLKDMKINWDRSHYIGWEKDKRDIKQTRKFLKKILNDKFEEKGYNKIRKKYPLFFEIGGDFRCKKADKMFKKEMHKAQVKKETAKKQFFHYLKKFENWWD